MAVCPACSARNEGGDHCPFCGHDASFARLARTERTIGCFWKALLGGGVLAFLLVVTGLFRSVPQGPSEKQIRAQTDVNHTYFQSAIQQLSQGDWPGAGRLLDRADEQFPKLYLVPLMRGQMLIFESARSRPTAALPNSVEAYLDLAISRDSSLAGPHFWKAVWLQSQGQREQALGELEEASRLLPTSYPHFSGRTGDYGRLIAALSSGLRKNEAIYLTARSAGLPAGPPKVEGKPVTVLDLPFGQ